MNDLIEAGTFPPEATGSAVRRASEWINARRWFSLFVVLPTLLATIYYYAIAADIYVSESRFVIKSQAQKQTQTTTLANLIQSTGLASGREQTSEVIEYIRSRNALTALQSRLDVRSRYASTVADQLSRYPAPWRKDRFENLFRYYISMITAEPDAETDVAVLKVRAFTAQDAHDINAQLLDLSEGLVNRLNERAQQKAISEAIARVAEAEDRLRRARVALAGFRNQQELIDPAKQATGVLEISNRLISERAALQAQLDLTTRVAPGNPAIPSLRSRISSISAEIATQNGRAMGTQSGIASKLGGYEKLAVEQEFATQMLNAANASLIQARTDAVRQQFYLERVVDPNTPDMALLPNRLRMVLTVAGAALCLYFIGWMLVIGILEHSPDE